jgi:hypothetical protein
MIIIIKTLTLGEITLVGQTRQDMRALEVIVIVGTKDVGRDNGSEITAKLIIIGTKKKVVQIII